MRGANGRGHESLYSFMTKLWQSAQLDSAAVIFHCFLYWLLHKAGAKVLLLQRLRTMTWRRLALPLNDGLMVNKSASFVYFDWSSVAVIARPKQAERQSYRPFLSCLLLHATNIQILGRFFCAGRTPLPPPTLPPPPSFSPLLQPKFFCFVFCFYN